MTACQNTPKTPALDMANFDLSVAPNADFYEYATGGWQKNNPLKPEYARYGSFDILRDNNEKRINELFSGMTQQKAEPGRPTMPSTGPSTIRQWASAISSRSS